MEIEVEITPKLLDVTKPRAKYRGIQTPGYLLEAKKFQPERSCEKLHNKSFLTTNTKRKELPFNL